MCGIPFTENRSDEHDWRLLAQRLGYSNDDIRAWASQHDPCMAVLSEWYATHKTREATYAVLTALQEMDRMDGAAIVENAMVWKQLEWQSQRQSLSLFCV
jgi:hypothetical protein